MSVVNRRGAICKGCMMKTKIKLRTATLVLTGLLVPACIQTCESTTSDGVLTTGLRGNFRAVAGSDGDTAVSGDLRVGGQLSNVYLELVGEDALTVSRGKTTEKMVRRSEPFGMVRYHASLDGNSAGKDIEVSFTRAVDKGAPKSTVRMPPAFELVSPPSGASLSRASDPLEVRWKGTSPEDKMTVVVSGSCIEGFSRTVEVDGGYLVLPAGTLKAPGFVDEMAPMEPVNQGPGAGTPVPVRAAEKCKVTVRAARTRWGKIDPGFGQGGSIAAEQYREVSINSLP